MKFSQWEEQLVHTLAKVEQLSDRFVIVHTTSASRQTSKSTGLFPIVKCQSISLVTDDSLVLRYHIVDLVVHKIRLAFEESLRVRQP